MGLASSLESLRDDPRFVKLMDLVGIEVDRLRVRMESGVFETVQQYAHAGGAIRGGRLPVQIITDVLEASVAESRRLEEREA